MKIGVFDSGKGGETVLAAIKELLPNEEYFYIGDSENCPYGEKSDEELMQIVRGHVETLKKWGARIIVIACNTATTRCIAKLRNEYSELKFVGTEPAIKLAAGTGAKRILVMATPGTIASERTARLMKEYQQKRQKIRLLACPGLADAIEANKGVKEKLMELLSKIPEPEVVVLGCTHYSLIKLEIQEFFPEAKLIDGNKGVAKRVEELIKQR
ncbi:glutamate racemase [Candidatus Saccharibacteria bacterium]|nr:glutamate racemase [Candidatus Saccharibacteria bacterium]